MKLLIGLLMLSGALTGCLTACVAWAAGAPLPWICASFFAGFLFGPEIVLSL